jgi:DNA polymerase beta palm
MSAGVDSVNRAGVTVASPEVLGFMAAKRTPRARATRQVEAVAHRLIAGGPPLDRARTLWVCGSYARGAPNVGDVDLLLEIDEPRDRAQRAADAYYRRAHPYAEVVKALVLSEVPPPPEAEASLQLRYQLGSVRYLAAAAALDHLKRDGVPLGTVQLAGGRGDGPGVRTAGRGVVQCLPALCPRVQAIPRRLAAPARVADAPWRPVARLGCDREER